MYLKCSPWAVRSVKRDMHAAGRSTSTSWWSYSAWRAKLHAFVTHGGLVWHRCGCGCGPLHPRHCDPPEAFTYLATYQGKRASIRLRTGKSKFLANRLSIHIYLTPTAALLHTPCCPWQGASVPRDDKLPGACRTQSWLAALPSLPDSSSSSSSRDCRWTETQQWPWGTPGSHRDGCPMRPSMHPTPADFDVARFVRYCVAVSRCPGELLSRVQLAVMIKVDGYLGG